MQVHKHRAGAQKQHQLDEGMVYHVQKRPPHRKKVLLPCPGKETGHSDASHDKPDLGHGRTGQGPLKIDGKHRKERPQKHGHKAKPRNKEPPAAVAAKHDAGHQDHAEHTGLGQDSRQQRAGRSRSHRMGLWQPDMQRKTPCLRTESKEHKPSCHVKLRFR